MTKTERSDVAGKLKRILEDIVGCDSEDVRDESMIVDDLGADSLDVVEMFMAAENIFKIEISEEDVERIETFGEFADLVAKKADR